MDSVAGKKKSSGSSSMLAPGFRFHPTDEELVRYYLRRKVCGKGFRFDAISEIDIYKAEPWDLPSFSRLKTRDLEWYFFSVLDKKYGNGARTNRATEKGYWKTTGKDRAVYHKAQIVGMKKTLVYHSGRAPKGQRTNWVMHEYRLADLELEKAGIVQDAFVLCRVFQKSGSGPKNGEQYGAPFVEEEWDDDELELVPKEEAAEEVDFVDDAYLDGDDLEQILGPDVPSDTSPLPLKFQPADGSYGEETAESVNDTQQLLVNAGEQYCEAEQHEDKNFYDLPAPYDMTVRAVKHEYIGESSKSGNSDDLDYLLDEPFLDSSDNLQYGNGGFIESNDLPNSAAETNTSAFDMLEEYLTFFGANDDNAQHFAYDPSVMLGSEELISDQALLPQELNGETEKSTLLSGQIDDNNDNDAASPSDKQDSAKYESDVQYPFIKQASHMLGSIPAPPAFAAEFPSKSTTLRLNSLSQPSSSVHVTAGMIQIRNLTTDGNGRVQSFGKPENFNIVLSFGFSRGNDGSASLESSVSILPGKTLSTLSRGWFCFIFFWVLILSMSFKIGTCICAK
ncbi:NAC domain-containing protein 53 isoform X1 [Sesamum indicum]|uniref:NAC domain-containing protein 53 isoform X1 n=1 Tax=Sesamum indicum TaxID=4182 RepID=A0A6I9T0S8_SESIN|nr:NAC domain-containing protein 53 isoform X1 [Sesamum indicum]